MAETKIDYLNNKGFWIDEIFMQLAFQYIYQEIQKPQYTFTNKPDLIYDCKAVIDGYRSGSLVLNWDDDLAGTADEQAMVLLLQNVITYLQTKGTYISVAEIQSLPTQDAHWLRVMNKKFPVAELVRIFNALRQMLQGQWQSTNYAMDINW